MYGLHICRKPNHLYRGGRWDFTHGWAIVAILVLNLILIYWLDIYKDYDF